MNKHIPNGYRMRLQTTGYYNMQELEPIGVVHGISVHAISFFRGLFGSVSGLFGGRQLEIEQKYLDVRAEAIADLTQRAQQMGADEVVGIEVETTELGNNFVVFIAAGTAMKRKHKGGKRKK